MKKPSRYENLIITDFVGRIMHFRGLYDRDHNYAFRMDAEETTCDLKKELERMRIQIPKLCFGELTDIVSCEKEK
jgi:hypothetical protein